MAKVQIFNFDELSSDGKAAQRMAKAFTRAGANVVQTESDGRIKRTLSVSYKELAFTFADGQQITLQIKKTGDVGTVKLNGKAVPIKNQDDQNKAVAELVQLMEANRAKFQAALAKKKAALPKGIKTAAPKMQEVLTARVAELDTQIDEKKASIASLEQQLAA
jgi:hypothetical protein